MVCGGGGNDRGLVALLAIVAAAITPGVAMAADFRVTTTADGDDKECVIDCTLREAVEVGAKVLWLQLGIASREAGRIAHEGGLAVVMNRCLAVEAARL